MSRFIIALVIFSLIIAGSIASVIYVSACEKRLQEYLDEIVISAQNGEMDKAESLSNAFVDKWTEVEPYIVMLVRHHSVDEITKYASRLASYCAYGNQADVIAETNRLKALLKHISDDEKPIIHNFM